MHVVRRHLRFGAATWLVCHVLAFSALLPRDCCAAHAHGAAAAGDQVALDHSAHGMPAATGHEHHTSPAPEDGAQCPMRRADGTPCPMHDGAGSSAACQMTGVCNQPAVALAAVLMQAAVPQAIVALLPRSADLVAVRGAHEQPHTLALPPDSPPPRL